MKYISSDKLKHHPDRLAEYLATGFSRPINAQLQITNRCPYRCVYCDKKLNNDESDINKKLIDRMISLGIKSIVLTGGEPTIHKEFSKVVSDLKQHFDLGLVTTLYKYHQELEDSFKWVKISLDTIDNEKYQSMKNGPKIGPILENIERLYKNKNKSVTVGIQIVLTNENKSSDDIERLIDRVIDHCDYIQIRPVESVELYPYTQECHFMLQILKDKYGKIIISDKFNLFHRPNNCNARWSQITVDIDHNVLLCCNRVNDTIGSIYDCDILEKYKNFKIDFSKCYVPCVQSGNNYYMKNLGKIDHINFV